MMFEVAVRGGIGAQRWAYSLILVEEIEIQPGWIFFMRFRSSFLKALENEDRVSWEGRKRSSVMLTPPFNTDLHAVMITNEHNTV